MEIPDYGNAGPGDTQEDHLPELQTAKRSAILLSVVACAAGLWAVFDVAHRGLAAALLVLIPWVAILLLNRAPGLYCIYKSSKSDPRNSLGIPLSISCFMLYGSARAAGAHQLDFRPLLWLIFLSAILLASGFAKHLLQIRSTAPLIVCFFLSAAYGYGLALAANCFLDHSPGVQYQSQVAAKRISSGGRGGRSYHLFLNPWGPERRREDVRVSSRLYRALEIGDTVCLTLHPGALGAAWHTVGICRPDNGQVFPTPASP